MTSLKTSITLFCVLLLLISPCPVESGPTAGAMASAGCAAVVVACYAAAGAVFGTVTAGAGTPAAILACNSAFGTCMQAACWATLTPTP